MHLTCIGKCIGLPTIISVTNTCNEESSIFFYFEKKKNLMSADNNKLPKHRK